MKSSIFLAIALSTLVAARPPLRMRASSFQLQNGQQAIQQNEQFKSLTADSTCTSGDACVNNSFAQCVGGNMFSNRVTPGWCDCAALPLVNSAGTSIACTTESDVQARIAATGASGTGTSTGSSSSASPSSSTAAGGSSSGTSSGQGAGNSSDAQSSTTLLSSVIATGFEQNGQGLNTSESGEVASLTSKNNFVNFCATVNLPITNGKQIKSGSCNPAPMGTIPSTSNMPSAKFVSPANLATVSANKTFQVVLAMKNLDTGFFTNAASNYFAAPQQLNSQGQIQGHSHIVIEALDSLNQTTPTDPTKFAFFQGINSKADSKGQLFANVTGGLPEGFYKMSTINSASNHQPVLVAVAQHGSLDDVVYVSLLCDLEISLY
ncbi:hypothetical protein CONPUDRAFT_46811 [Coniophora puteana RWD-64-598 SS2]|uniref:Uncharacterized protein n=1 Tax=Coniophora puteana (strain RWD-64-598) TaxID=741705 RepID=A0A5M3N5M7_CONPW|nr:uncharacterized protein CONPUDRAFT_46811 [Coniophora puteana RWD-64-598 SS2]EIW86374.1 hypothetical protein CONPUDRAFT_46811 [Coniophora puteana RWD-64-598 SS2]